MHDKLSIENKEESAYHEEKKCDKFNIMQKRMMRALEMKLMKLLKDLMLLEIISFQSILCLYCPM